MKDSNIEFTDNNNWFILSEKKESIDWLLFSDKINPMLLGVNSIFESLRFFVGSVPKLFPKSDFAGNFTVFYLETIFGTMKDSNIEFTYSINGTNYNRFILSKKKEPIDWLLFLWQDKPVVVVCEFNIWILHSFFFGNVPKLFSKLDFAENFTVFEMYLKPDIPHPRHFWYLYAKILVKDSITAVVASGVVVALVVNLAVFFINDGSKGSCTAGRQKEHKRLSYPL